MNFKGNNSIKNNVFSGAYSIFINPIDESFVNFWQSKNIDPNGVVGNFVYYSKGGENIESGYYQDESGRIASGASSEGNASGYLYYRISTPIFGVCHGFGNDSGSWISGYNFYNAFHPEGYISPPFGQHITVFKNNDNGAAAIYDNYQCTLTQKEYTDIFGIVSETKNKEISFINSPAVGCPQAAPPPFFWKEKNYNIIGGTASSITSNLFFNSNPIPTSLDAFDIRLDFRYQSNPENLEEGKIKYNIAYDSEGKPLPNYSIISSEKYLLNYPVDLCNAFYAENILSQISTQIQSQILDVADYLPGEASKGLFDGFNWWNTWHFLFKENSDGFPMASEGHQGSQLFQSSLSNLDYYWENRQCPSIVDFLPHTFGASIYACPSYHFDIPYYAAINKFGFYGTRFLNGCLSLNLTYPSSGGIQNSQEIPTGYSYDYPEEKEPNEESPTFYSDEIYDNLLKVAKSEEVTNDFFAFNKILFLWFNIILIKNSEEYKYLKNKYLDFENTLYSYIGEYEKVFPSGKKSLLKNDTWYQSSSDNIFYSQSNSYDFLLNSNDYKNLNSTLIKLLKSGDGYYWEELKNKYLNSILKTGDNGIEVDTGFYNEFENSKLQRLQTRYLENYIKGNPIDLFPSNKITFGYDKAKNYIDSFSWGKSLSAFGRASKFEDTGIDRRYFVGAYGENLDYENYAFYINQIEEIKNSSFYPGFFHSQFPSESFQGGYVPVITGNFFNNGAEINIQTIKNGLNPLSFGWFALGYNEIGNLKNNYSCFTPIFVQQPLPFVHCKIGQSPTFRSFAVDYHTIPEDKINVRYPEIMYWAKKLKILDKKDKNKYPLSYKWYRIKKENCDNDFKKFITSGYFSVKQDGDIYHTLEGDSSLEPANITGNWCCLEENGPFCTLIHPKECDPPFNGSSFFSYKNIGSPSYEEAKRNNFYMAFKKGAIKDQDDKYYYFCVVKGRFGIRISEASELFIDNHLQFDVSIQNGGNSSFSLPITFKGVVTGSEVSISMNSSNINNYEGFYNDPYSVPEDVIEMQIPPPNKGWGAVYSYRFVGSWGYVGAFQSYTPGTLNDTRGLKQTWGRFLHYGSLIKYSKNLTQTEGDLLYGTNHLPECVNGEMPSNRKGVKIVFSQGEGNESRIVHWANVQKPIVSTDGKRGIKWDKLQNAGGMYNPASNYANGVLDESIGIGLGQWQWGNNLGTIHSFGYKTQNSSLLTSPGRLSDSDIIKLKNKLLKNTLAGAECGWIKQGLGRNMLYWIEGFESFYSLCDPIKKKNVTNYSYMNPGLRFTNSSIQYFWLGKPSNSYLMRYPMHGPYAYQWKMMPHNRDRNGNGMSEGFYSYGWETNYSLMYDAPAIYGLFSKYKDPSANQIQFLNELRSLRGGFFGNPSFLGVRNTRFGFTFSGAGGSRPYGNFWVGNIDDPIGNDKISSGRGYINSGELLASNPKFNLYGCEDSDLINGDCFDPCISIRYANGLMPGGKKQQLTTAVPNSNGYSIVANNFYSGDSFYEKTIDISGKFFRGPFGTPHHKYLKSNGINLNGFSPCFDGGADHCNYITPTMNLGASCYLEDEVPSFLASAIETSIGLNLELTIQ